MKVIFAIKSFTVAGGAERVFCSVANALSQRGHEVVAVSFDSSKASLFYSLSNSIRIIRIGLGDSQKTTSLVEFFRRTIALRRVLVEENPDVLVAFMHSMYVPMALSSFGLSLPLVGSEHTVPRYYYSRPIEYLLIFLCSPLLNKITVVSESIRDTYPQLLRKRMEVIPNPVLSVSCKANHISHKDLFILLSVGRLENLKDHSTLISAFSLLAESFPDWRLKIFGDGPLRDDLVAQINSLGLCEQVTLPGVTPHLALEYCSADVFVLPSRYESFGLVTLEAMSHGLPVVGFSDCSGTNQLIEDNVSGFLVNPGGSRSKSLSIKLEQLFLDRQMRFKMGQEGIKAAERISLSDNVLNKWEQLLFSVGKI